MFEIPLQNVVAAPGADVLLKCIITANPPPQGELQGWAQAMVETQRGGGRGGGTSAPWGWPDPCVCVTGDFSESPGRGEGRPGLL